MKNNFHKKDRKAFTIVELVIVIAVIAILAAVLIPTFANIIKKANLNSDMQAVRSMNLALADWEAANNYEKPATITKAMKIIADAGYDVDSWNPLTSDYKVYWYSKDNRCILYNSKTAQVEYPKEYSGKDLTDIENASYFFIYNQTFKKALDTNIEFDNSQASEHTINGVDYTSSVVFKKSDASDSTYVNLIAQEEVVNGEAVTNYTFAFTADPSSANYVQDKAKAEKDAGEYLYSMITKANNQLINLGNVVFEPGSVIDISDYAGDFKPLKVATGHWGVTDAQSGFNPDAGTPDEQYEAGTYKPVVIKGLTIDDSLSFSETYISRGANNPIYLTGFIGMVYGTATIENIRFENVTIDKAAMDRVVSNTNADASNSAIIGGITRLPGSDGETNVKIRNVVAKSVKIDAIRRASGIVGYIGGYGEVIESGPNKGDTIVWGLKGTIEIDNCSFDGTVNSLAGATNGYSVTGGIVGYINKEGTYISKVVNNSGRPTGFVGNVAISDSKTYDFKAPTSDSDKIIITVKNCTSSGILNGGRACGIVAEYSNTSYNNVSTSKLKIINCTTTVNTPNIIASNGNNYSYTDKIVAYNSTGAANIER